MAKKAMAFFKMSRSALVRTSSFTKLGEFGIFRLHHPPSRKSTPLAGGCFANRAAKYVLSDTQIPSGLCNPHAPLTNQLHCLQFELPSEHPSSTHPTPPRPSLHLISVSGISGEAQNPRWETLLNADVHDIPV